MMERSVVRAFGKRVAAIFLAAIAMLVVLTAGPSPAAADIQLEEVSKARWYSLEQAEFSLGTCHTTIMLEHENIGEVTGSFNATIHDRLDQQSGCEWLRIRTVGRTSGGDFFGTPYKYAFRKNTSSISTGNIDNAIPVHVEACMKITFGPSIWHCEKFVSNL